MISKLRRRYGVELIACVAVATLVGCGKTEGDQPPEAAAGFGGSALEDASSGSAGDTSNSLAGTTSVGGAGSTGGSGFTGGAGSAGDGGNSAAGANTNGGSSGSPNTDVVSPTDAMRKAARDAARAAAARARAEAAARQRQPDPLKLLGDYDVDISSIPEVEGCKSEFTELHLNFQINSLEDKPPTAVAFADFTAPWETQPLKFERALLIVDETRNNVDDLVSPGLRLEVDVSGFTRKGHIRVPYVCAEKTRVFRDVEATLRPDRTPPKLMVSSSFPTPKAFSFGGMRVLFSEPVLLQDDIYYSRLMNLEHAARTLEFIDVATQKLVAASWQAWPWGQEPAFWFADQEAVSGRNVELRIKDKLTDHEGNQAVVVNPSWFIHGGKGPFSKLDFDVDTYPFSDANVKYYPPGASGSPCEAGGCVELIGIPQSCKDNAENEPTSYLALRPKFTGRSKLRVRARAWGTAEQLAAVNIIDARGCSGSFWAPPLAALPSPDGRHTHASVWLTHEFGFCLDPEPSEGVLLALGCDAPGVTRVVIESIEVVPIE